MATQKKAKTKVNVGKALSNKRAQKRRTRTEGVIVTTLDRLGPNPFHMIPGNIKTEQATKSLIRAIRRFKQDYQNICDKYSVTIPAEPMTRHAVVSTLSDEIRL